MLLDNKCRNYNAEFLICNLVARKFIHKLSKICYHYKMKAKEILIKHEIASTPLREQILQILLDAKAPIDCETLIKQTGANKTTIYRNLAIFEEKGLLTHTQNARKAFYELNDTSKAYFVCDICHKMEQIDMPKIPHKHIKTITVQGICDECSE